MSCNRVRASDQRISPGRSRRYHETEVPAGVILGTRNMRMACHESRLHRTDRTSREHQGRRPAQARAGAGAGAGARSAQPRSIPIDLYIRSGMVAMPLAFPYVIGCDLAGTVEKVGPGAKRFKVGRSRLGIEPGAARPPGRGLGVRGRRRGLALSDARPSCPTTRPRRWPWSASRRTSASSVTASSRRARPSMSPAAAAASARWSSRWPRRPGRGSPRRPAARNASSSAAASAPTSRSTTRPTTCPPGSASSPRGRRRLVRDPARAQPRGLHPPAPQARPHDPDGRPHRQARAAARGLLPRNCALLGFAMFNATPEEQRPAPATSSAGSRRASSSRTVGRTFPLDAAAEAEKFLEANTAGGRRDAHREGRDHHRLTA